MILGAMRIPIKGLRGVEVRCPSTPRGLVGSSTTGDGPWRCGRCCILWRLPHINKKEIRREEGKTREDSCDNEIPTIIVCHCFIVQTVLLQMV